MIHLLQLIEVVMDYGEVPIARFPSGDVFLSEDKLTMDNIQRATDQVCPVYD